jgi:hypothetical protein
VSGFRCVFALLVLFVSVSPTLFAQPSYTWKLAWQAPPSGGNTLFGLAYDLVRNQAVLLDNAGGTWTWTSAARMWTRQYPAHNPSNRSAGAMSWDGNRNGVLLFGGNSGGPQNDTWLWDGADWNLLPAAAPPPARHGAHMVWDSVQKHVVLFGGQTGTTPNTVYGDTWIWDGAGWTQISPAGSAGLPAGRYNFAMEYDPVNQAVVIYGGNQGTPSTCNDTWLLTTSDGVAYAWSNPLGPSPTSDYAPIARNNVTMAWDAIHRVMTLFGGSANSAETWDWDTSTLSWTFQGIKVSPTGRSQHMMWWDPVIQQVLLTGGNGGGNLNDVWGWDGVSVNWTALTPNQRFGASMAYDSTRQSIFMTMGCNGLGNTRYNDFWVWNGATWISRAVAGAPINPVPRALAGTVYDPVADAILTWSGATGTGNTATVNNNYVYSWSPGSSLWAGMLPGVRPNTRIGYGWSYVPGPGTPVTVMFGGGDILPNVYSDTFVWDSAAGTYTAQSGTGPSARGGVNMIYDSVRGQVVLFGGTTSLNQTTTNVTTAGVDDNDTWIGTWDGKNFTWTNAIPNGASGSPRARSWHSMAFDGQYVWMTGGMAKGDEKAQQVPGKTADFFNDLWRWDGARWTEVTPATGPEKLAAMAMAFDPNHGSSGPGGTGQMVLFGGNYITGTGNGTVNANSSTWVWDVAQPGTIRVSTYTTQSGTIQDMPEATFTVFGPCTLADASPCKKKPVDGGPAYSEAGLEPGFYSVAFNAVPGYNTPYGTAADPSATPPAATSDTGTENIMLGSGGAITFSANYTPIAGGITVNAPADQSGAAVSGSPAFSIAGPNGYTYAPPSGFTYPVTVSNLAWGDYTVTFTSLDGYPDPAPITITLNASTVVDPAGVPQTVAVNGVY